MKPFRTYTIVPRLPAELERLRELAYNLRWAWNHDTIALFRRLDPDLWNETNHNPVKMLGRIEQAALQEASQDVIFLAHLNRVYEDFRAYLDSASPWYRRAHPSEPTPLVAYFSAEFGLTECLSIFAGGLGLLAGDHLKSASDLGVPLVGVGLLYQQGYFRQELNEAGWQQEIYENNDFHNLPIVLTTRPDGSPLTVSVDFPNRTVVAQVWKAQVGRVALYLLDTNLPANRPEDGNITDQLYGGDIETRVQQEIVLGIGGYRALEALGLRPTVYHMNEGHSAFLGLERARRLMETQRLTFAEAREAASAGLVFTTHTPVAAGHDYFPTYLMDRYFSDYARALGITRSEFLGLGRQNPFDENEPFCMTVLALRLATHGNGVSKLHGEVSRRMWHRVWPGVPENEIPIGSVTNGVHFLSWISSEMKQLYDRYLGPRWREEPADESVWREVEHMPAVELWRSHERRRERLVAFARSRLRGDLKRRGVPNSEFEAADEVLDPDALTIGFARRFATYKRAALLFRDPDRLARILNDPKRPIQIIFAGKAHPRDDAGKDLIRQIIQFCRQERFRRRLVFMEQYDTSVARYLVQGADVWLNTPRRPLEASGTSGMKAAANGVLNLSTLDGWWDEAWRAADDSQPPIGWAIGKGEEYDNADYQDQVEAEALYDLLEQDVAPTFYERGADGLPRKWIARMKSSIGQLNHFFNTDRMVRDYTEQSYLPADARFRALTADYNCRAGALAAWKAKVERAWSQVRLVEVDGWAPREIPAGECVEARVVVQLGELSRDDVRVEMYAGLVDARGEIVEPRITVMTPVETTSDGLVIYRADVGCGEGSGLHGYTVRVLPSNPDLATRFIPGLIAWPGHDTRS